MNEKFNKNAKVEQLTKMFLSRGEEKGLIVKDPLKRDLYTKMSPFSIRFNLQYEYGPYAHFGY